MGKQHDFCYIRNTVQERFPQLLGIILNGKGYFFLLETFHLNQHIRGIRNISQCHSHKVFHIVRYTDDCPSTNMRINDQTVPVATGAVVMLPPEVPHIFQPTGSDAFYDEITFSLINADGDALSDCDFSTLFTLWSGLEYNKIEYVITPSGILRHELKKHYQEIAGKLKNSGANIFPALTSIADMMFSLMNHMTGVEVDADPRLLQARAYIENHYLQALSLKVIAKQAGMSHEYFCKQFKKEFGLAPLQYRQQLRINAAEQLLSISELQITEIADRLGFSDIYAFSRAFKNHTGTAPARFRSRCRKSK